MIEKKKRKPIASIEGTITSPFLTVEGHLLKQPRRKKAICLRRNSPRPQKKKKIRPGILLSDIGESGTLSGSKRETEKNAALKVTGGGRNRSGKKNSRCQLTARRHGKLRRKILIGTPALPNYGGGMIG